MHIENLITELEKFSLLKHPFYQAWGDGKLNREILAEYACQYFHHVDAFSRYISAIHTQCQDLKTRQVLLGNLVDEEMGEENHPELWLRFGEALGASRRWLKDACLNPETKQLVEGFFQLCKGSVEGGLGALFAYERQVPAVAQSKIDGLKKFYNLHDEKALQFFHVHIEADKWHSEECENLLATLDPVQKKAAENAAIKAAKLLWEFLDGVYKRIPEITFTCHPAAV